MSNPQECEWTAIYRANVGEHAEAVLDVLRADGYRAEILECSDGDPPRAYWSRGSRPKVWIGVPAEQAQGARAMLASWEAANETRVASADRALRRLVLLGGTLLALFYIAISAASERGDTLLRAGLVLLLTGVGLWAFIRARRRARRIPLGLCPRCQYDLRGNSSGRCPECGKRIRGRRLAATRTGAALTGGKRQDSADSASRDGG